MKYSTMYINKEIIAKENISDVVEYIAKQEECFFNWKQYINDLVMANGGSYIKFAERIGFSKNTVKKWCNEGALPQNRDAFIRIAFGLGMDIDATNKLLSYGKYAELYAKDLHDAIIIYVLNKRKENPNDERYRYDNLLLWYDKLKPIISKHKSEKRNHYNKQTIGVYNTLNQLKDDEDFEKYVYENKGVFSASHDKLISFIDKYFEYNKKDIALNDNTRDYTWHNFIKEYDLDAAIEKSMSTLRNQRLLPKRDELILIGVYLNMSVYAINDMLKLANMRELYARDKTEALLMYILCDINKRDHSFYVEDAFFITNYYSDEELKTKYQKIIAQFYATEDEICEETDDRLCTVVDYIRYSLENININKYCSSLLGSIAIENRTVSASIVTHKGNICVNNEDNFYVNGSTLPMGEEQLYVSRSIDPPLLAAVCDGMGGEGYGDIAANISVKHLRELHTKLNAMDPENGCDDGSSNAYLAEYNAYASLVNNEICDILGNTSSSLSGCTIAAVYIKNDIVYPFSLGDSRVYTLYNNTLTQITTDNTLAMKRYRMGQCTLDEALSSDDKHKLTLFLGADYRRIGLRMNKYTPFKWYKGMKLLICSDGLYNMCSENDIKSILSQDDADPEELLKVVIKNGGDDNITYIILQ